MKDTQDIEDLIRTVQRAVARGDIDSLVDLLDPNVVYQEGSADEPGPVHRGREAVLAALRAGTDCRGSQLIGVDVADEAEVDGFGMRFQAQARIQSRPPATGGAPKNKAQNWLTSGNVVMSVTPVPDIGQGS